MRQQVVRETVACTPQGCKLQGVRPAPQVENLGTLDPLPRCDRKERFLRQALLGKLLLLPNLELRLGGRQEPDEDLPLHVNRRFCQQLRQGIREHVLRIFVEDIKDALS